MSGETPAGHLARLKVQHPAWTLRFVAEGFGFDARRGGERLWSQTIGGLEAKLNAADSRGMGQRQRP